MNGREPGHRNHRACMVRFLQVVDDLNDELDEPLVDPEPVKFIKKGLHYTIRVIGTIEYLRVHYRH